MKQLLLLLLLFSAVARAQSLRVTAAANRDNRLESNQPVSSVHLCVIGPGGDTVIFEQADLSGVYDRSLAPGRYELIAVYDTFPPIVLKNVHIMADRILFMDLLFEPVPRVRKGFFTGVERRGRKTKKGLQPQAPSVLKSR